MTEKILRERDVAQLDGGLSRSTRWRLERDGFYPKRRKLGRHSVGWKESEITEWLKDPEGWAEKSAQAAA
ncbi:MAG: AlpA family phage regulatory protein [Candidatus Thiodiazotropha endolucinida]